MTEHIFDEALNDLSEKIRISRAFVCKFLAEAVDKIAAREQLPDELHDAIIMLAATKRLERDFQKQLASTGVIEYYPPTVAEQMAFDFDIDEDELGL